MNTVYMVKNIKKLKTALQRIICTAAILCLVILQGYATIRYVVPSGTGDGSSWANASGDIAAIIAASSSGDQIWVKKGTYTPATSLNMKNGVALYGGFEGTETLLSQRNFANNLTIISGGGTKRIFNVASINKAAILDGFTITQGNAGEDRGGAMHVNGLPGPIIRNCIFSNNAGKYGAAIYIDSSSPLFENCVFTDNNGDRGAAMYLNFSAPTITNSIFHNNRGGNYGGAIYSYESAPKIISTVFIRNFAYYEGSVLAIYNVSRTTPSTITNCIVFNNETNSLHPEQTIKYSGGAEAKPTITYSLLQEYVNHPTNIYSNPSFVNSANPKGADNKWLTADDGLKVLNSSSCIKKGTAGDGTPATDILGNPRLTSTPTIGAYENANCAFSKIYVNLNVAVSGDGSTWATAKKTINEAFAIRDCVNIDTIWVAQGTYVVSTPLNMKSGLALLGGFNGTETMENERNPNAHPTILSGGGMRRVFVNEYVNATAVIDGFTITNGYTSGNDQGAGMLNYYSQLRIENCKFFDNTVSGAGSGGAMANIASNVTVRNCLFKGNSAQSGGAISINSASPIIQNCVFEENSGALGGAIYATYSQAIIRNCILIGNTAQSGGALYFYFPFSEVHDNMGNLINCTIIGNSSSIRGGAVYQSADQKVSLNITNSIIYNNTSPISNSIYVNSGHLSLNYSNVEEMGNGTNISTDPIFVNSANPKGADGIWMTADDGLAIKDISSCINFGVSGQNAPTTDILGVERHLSTPTIGAYENKTHVTNRVYVNGNVVASGDGRSWATAKKTIDEAFSLAHSNSAIYAIWVAQGTYTPNNSLSMKNGVAIYGGFLGTEEYLHQRNSANNLTIISGNGQRRVFYNTSLDNTSILDGFIISDGYTTGNGAGMYNLNSHPIIRNCIFKNNSCNTSANEGGGGMFNEYSNPTLTNCVFDNNKVYNNKHGGGMFNYYSDPTLNNCVFVKNSITGNGAAMYNFYAYPKIINNTFTSNETSLGQGGAIFNATSSIPTITNSIIHGNTASQHANVNQNATITYSNIEGGYSGTGNINVDPIFKNKNAPAGADGKWLTVDDGLILMPCSPAINAGIETTPALSNDILGNTRLNNYEMGAYEYRSESFVITATPICKNISTLSLFATTHASFNLQWQSSPTLGSGYVDIAGATNLSYVATLNAYTTYRLKLTCILSGQIIYSNIISLNPSPVYANYLNYCQSFDESWPIICGEGDAPTVHWKTVNTSGDVDAWWRRDDGFALAPAWTNNAGAYSPSSKAGNHSARFHTAGTTAGLKGSLDFYVNLSNSSTKNLEFYHINASGTDVLKVYISADGGNNFTQIGNSAGYGVNATWTKITIDISSHTSATSVIRFEGTSDGGNSDIGLDEVCIVTFSTATLKVPEEIILCKNASLLTYVVSSSNGNATLSISPADGLSASTGTGQIYFTVAPTATTVYTVTSTENINGATVVKTAEFTVTVKDIVAPTVTTSLAFRTCLGGNIQLSSNSNTATNYSWTGPNGFTSNEQNPMITNATSAMSGFYYLTVSNDECINTSFRWTVVDVSPPELTANVTNASCGTNSGTIRLNLDDESGTANSYLWQPGGQTTKDISGLAPGDYTVTVTFQNGCVVTKTFRVNNVGLTLQSGAYSITDEPDQIIEADEECTRSDGWTIYYHGATKKFVMAIKKNGNDIGTVGDGTFKAQAFTTTNFGSGTATRIRKAEYLNNGSWYVMNRYWKVTPTQQPTSEVVVRFYYTQTDLDDLMGSVPGLQEDDIRFYKINGNYDPNPSNGHVGVPLASNCNTSGLIFLDYTTGDYDCTHYKRNIHNGAQSADFVVTEFSGGGGGAIYEDEPLPINLLSFTAKANACIVQLNWSTAEELNFNRFELEKSSDGIHFEKIAAFNAKGNNSQYAFTDEYYLNKTHFYRLVMIDNDGSATLSKTVNANMHCENRTITLSPNPAKDVVMIKGLTPGEIVQLTDANCRILFTQIASSNLMNINLVRYSSGMYFVQIVDKQRNKIKTQKLVVE